MLQVSGTDQPIKMSCRRSHVMEALPERFHIKSVLGKLVAKLGTLKQPIDRDFAYAETISKLVDVPVACPETYMATAMFIADMDKELRPHTLIVHTSNPDGGKAIADLLQDRVSTIIMKIARYNKKGAPWI